jgi:hypothetical protein
MTQSKAEFTPGPWNLVNQEPKRLPGWGEEYVYEIESPNGNPLLPGESWQTAIVYGTDVPDDQTESDRIVREIGLANAHLIAAAPELYEVVEAFVAEWDKGTVENKTKIADMFKHVLKGREALGKARGEAT